MSTFGAVFELSWLNGTDGFQVNGEVARDYSGTSAASAGDVNGDGYDDLIIGATRADPNGSGSGATYVVFGAADGFSASLELSELDGTNGFQINGEAAGDYSASSVASAGDVNGDGYDDLIIAAMGADPNGSGSGATYVVFGAADGFSASLELSELDGTNGFQINGEAASDQFGRSIASAGDVNGDGFSDLLIGATGADLNGDRSGASYVVFGKEDGFSSSLELSELNGTNGFKINGETALDFFGHFVASAGDVNGDGYDDIILGASGSDPYGNYSGASYVVFGTADGFSASLELSNLDGTNGFKINGEAEYDGSGSSIYSAGDVNGDGFDDLIIGAFGADPNGSRSGASYLVFGKEDGFRPNLNLSTLNGTNGFQINGEEENDVSGYSVASAGDVNGDGYDDLIIAAMGADPNGSGSGATYVVFGAADGFSASLELSELDGTNGFQINGEAAGDYSGRSVASAGDVNGDGYDDLIIGAYLANPNGGDSGATYIIFGKQTKATIGDDLMSGASGAETINGLAGNDTLLGAAGADQLFGGLGSDSISGGTGADTLIGATGSDTLSGDGGADVVSYVGSDAGVSVNLASGTTSGGHAAGDVISGFEGVIGSSYADTVTGGATADSITGAAGADQLFGGLGSDSISGGTGADTLIGATGSDTLSGDGGADVVSYVGSDAGVSVNLASGTTSGGHAAGDVISGFEGAIGSSYADTVTGGATADSITGGAGDDRLSGADGVDWLIGGAGKDTLTGGDGNDTFIFKFASESSTGATTADAITDFAKGKDRIDLSAIDAFASSAANDTFIWKDTAAFNSTSKGEVRYEKFDNKGTANDYTMVWIDTDADRDVEMAIRLTGLHSLSSSDFIL